MSASWARKASWSAFTAWHLRAEARLPYWPRETILALQGRRVRALVRHAYDTVAYYREAMDAVGLHPADVRSADTLAALPVLTGAQVAREPERFLSRRYAGGGALALRSSGTSGRLRVISYDPAALFLALAHGHRQRLVFRHFIGRTAGYREMVATRPGSIGDTIRGFYERSAWIPRRLELRRRPLSPADPWRRSLELLNEFRPEVLQGYGSHLGLLFRRALAAGAPVARPRLIVYGGDPMPAADRALIEDELRVPVLSTYQAAETLRLGYQCEERRGFHVSEDHVAVRVVDAQGRPVGPGGTGEIIVSNLTNCATVLLNYKLGDVVTLGAAPCPCGRTQPTIERIEGRDDDFIVRPDGEAVHALVVQSALHRVPGVIQVQIVQEAPLRFQLLVVSTGTAGWPETQGQVEAAMRGVLGVERLSLVVERVDAVPQAPTGKVRAVVSYCRPGALPAGAGAASSTGRARRPRRARWRWACVDDV